MGRKALDYLKELYRRYGEDGCDTAAAALSFFAILSLVPILLCGIAALGFVVRDPQSAAREVQEFVAHLIPSSNSTEIARRLIAEVNIEKQAADLMALRGWAALIGGVSLLWSATRIFVNAIPALNSAFNATETRNFFVKQAHAFGILFGAGILFLLSLVVSALPTVVSRQSYFDTLPIGVTPLITVLAFLLGVVVNSLMFAVIYRFLPSPAAKVTWKQALIGGIAAAVIWEILKQGFAFYLSHFGDSYNKVYGSLAGLVIVVLWIYYSSQLLLVGAEVAQIYGERQAERRKVPKAEIEEATTRRPARTA